jgi:hypothetical protein
MLRSRARTSSRTLCFGGHASSGSAAAAGQVLQSVTRGDRGSPLGTPYAPRTNCRRWIPADVVAPGLFELDHLGAEKAEDLGAGRPRLVVCHVDDANARQRLAHRALLLKGLVRSSTALRAMREQAQPPPARCARFPPPLAGEGQGGGTGRRIAVRRQLQVMPSRPSPGAGPRPESRGAPECASLGDTRA